MAQHLPDDALQSRLLGLSTQPNTAERKQLTAFIAVYYAIPEFVASHGVAWLAQTAIAFSGFNELVLRHAKPTQGHLFNPLTHSKQAAVLVGLVLIDAATTRALSLLLRALQIKHPHLLIAGCAAASVWVSTTASGES